MKATLASFVLLAMLCGQAIGQEGPPPFRGPNQSSQPPMMNQPGGPPPRMGPVSPVGPGRQREWWRDPELVQKLQISDDQLRKIEKIRRDPKTRDRVRRSAAGRERGAIRLFE